MEDNNKPEFKLFSFEDAKKGSDEPLPGSLMPAKYNLTVHGRTMRMRVEPCSCGMRAVYFNELCLADMLPKDAPSFLIDATKDKKKHFEVVDEHISLTWKDKLLGRGYGYYVLKFHERIKKIIEDLDKTSSEADRIVKELS